MKAAEKNANKNAHYELLENEVDSHARECFLRPAHVHSKLTTIAAIRIIEHNIDRLDDGSRKQLEEVAQKSMKRNKAAGG